jgi:hypothetical protein
MGYKEEFLSELIRSDRTGYLQRLHERLVGNRLKYKASANSDTLLYYVLDGKKKQVGLAAFRVNGQTIFSFPKTYWQRHSSAVNVALSVIPHSSIVETEGFVSSSQNSMRQVLVSSETVEILLHVIDNFIVSHAQSAAA